MRIAHIACTFPPYKGGIGNIAYDYSKITKKRGHEVSVFTPQYKRKKASEIEGVKIFRLKPFLKYGNAAFVPQLFYYLFKFKFDVVYLHYPFFGGAEIVWLAKLLFPRRFKLVIHYHMDVVGLPSYIKILAWPSCLVRASLFKRAEKVTCASLDYVKNSQIKKNYQRFSKKFVEIPFGVKTQVGDNSFREENQILFVGGLDKAHYFKGVDILLEAFSQLDDDKRLRIVGSGDLEAYYKKYAQELGVDKRAYFLGNLKLSELIQEYQKASVLVLPSINKCEAFGVVLIEAMSFGTPVIASSLPGVRKVFEDKKQGFFVTPGDVEDLRLKLNLFFKNRAQKKDMSVAADELVRARYDIKKIEQSLNSLYESLFD